ncbi:MAG: protein kinase [Kofleriaceae bacterium]
MYCPVCHSDYPVDWKACPTDATLLLKSAQIGKYRIEGLLGVGGMGAVYRASNPDTKGRVAIKVMNPAVAGAESARARFQREAAAVAALRTSHVVKVYDFGTETDGTLYLVMELMDGHPLRDEITPAPGYMDLARVQMVLEGALKGLAAAHKVGIVHRDLKPENIYVADTDDGEVPKLLDFGIARVRTRDQDLTRTGSLMGTASYMASEQIVANAGEIGAWSDVYAMGAILYEMLAGTPAFGGNTVTEVLQRVLKAESVPLRTLRAGLPEPVYALVERCMSPEPAKRPQDAEAMRSALAAARMVPAGTAIPPASKTRVDTSPPAMGSDVGMMATEGRDTPIPASVTPPHGAYAQRDAILHPQAPPQQTFGSGTGNAGTASLEIPPARKRSALAFVIGGVAIVAIGAFAIIKATTSSEPAAVPRDAQIVASLPDAAVTPDAAVVRDAAVVTAAPVVPDGMVAITAGAADIGELKPASAESLAATHVTHDEFWIDRVELTLGALRAALKNSKAGGVPGDKPEVPARNITHAQAAAACKALGKRLPTETEWEVAAQTTPGEPAKAAMFVGGGGPKLVATKHTDCSVDGLCDMLGGVLEWTADVNKTARVVRGSSFTVAPNAGWQASLHFRAFADPNKPDSEIGVRCAFSHKANP